RQWQVLGADCCLDHGQLLTANVERRSHHRHEFFPATPKNCPSHEQNESSYQSRAVTKQVISLLDCPSLLSPSSNQWTSYYRWIVQSSGLNRGRQIQYEAIKQRVIEHWGQQWLSAHGLAVNDRDSCWLRAIFRKHHNSFSYLEHIVVLDAFLSADWLLTDEIKSVSTHPKEPHSSCKVSVSRAVNTDKTDAYRDKWLGLLRQFGAKQARTNGGKAVYAWLYRYDRDWLLGINKQHQRPKKAINIRVDWKVRDRAIVRSLCKIRDEYASDLNSPRRTMNWFLSHIDHSATVERKRSELPLTRLFLDKYCESIENYQIRRINNAIKLLAMENKSCKRWKIMRISGLSEERLREQARQLLEIIVRDNG
ncbi:MAG: TnsD family Tn7-like transposition protein, partial [Methylobacter sp.]